MQVTFNLTKPHCSSTLSERYNRQVSTAIDYLIQHRVPGFSE